MEDIGNVEKRGDINANTTTPLDSLYKGMYLMASTPSIIDFPKGIFLTEGATRLGEGETGLAFLNKLNDEMVVVKVPRFIPSIEKQFKIDKNYFIVGKSMPNEKEALQLQGLFVDEKNLDDGRSIVAMKVAPEITRKDFIRGGNIKTKKELEVLFDSTFEAMQKMWIFDISFRKMNL